MIKLLYPHGEFTVEEVEEILRYALVGRRRVKEQLKKIAKNPEAIRKVKNLKN